jgi:hypothetical protein
MDNVHVDDHAVFQVQPTRTGLEPPRLLRTLSNFDLDSDGSLASRTGATSIQVLAAGRRVYAKGGLLLVQDGATLAAYTDRNLTPLADTGLVLTGDLLAHEWPTGGDHVFCTDGAIRFRLKDGVLNAWGLPVLAAPTVTAIAGTLPAASYLIAATARDGAASVQTAQESGANAPLMHTLATAGGMRLTLAVPNTLITHVAFYVSGPDQPEPFRVAVVAPVVNLQGVRIATLDLTTVAQLASTEVPLLSQGWGPLPAGVTALGSTQAYVLAAKGNGLYRSWPGQPGLFRYGQGIQLFPADITTVVGVQNGAYVGTTQGLYWLGGENPAAWARVKVDDVPVIPDGLSLAGGLLPTLEVDAPVALFATRLGLVAGLPGGQVRHLSRDRYHWATATRVSMAYRSSPLRQVLVAVVEP